ncbi:hypothetical protein C8R43DRAFT_1134993 [Mycena crocata]|nr:hypothetical protein C8R43DRAFT_1134993 [Mycena crocata]
MSTILAAQILEHLLAHTSLRDNLQFFHIQRFFEFTNRIWPEITPANEPRPVWLPAPIANFLAAVLNLDKDLIQLTWQAFGDLAEIGHKTGPPPSLDDDFQVHGHSYSIGAEFLGPPISSCTNPTCKAPPLALIGEENQVEARLYTLRRGVLPVFSKSRYCRFCHTRYYNNYFVRDAKEPTAKRQYYSDEIPKFIHVTETSFVDPELCAYIPVLVREFPVYTMQL